MSASKQIARVLIAFMVVGAALSSLAPVASAQNPIPVISLTMSPGERIAEITASAPRAVQFIGNFTVDKLSFERATVTLLAVMSTGWVATVSPASVTVTNQRTMPFTVTVVVPAGELAVNIGSLTVTGRVVAGGLQSQAQAQAIVTPAAYFRIIASSTNPFIESPYSQQTVIAYRIYNEGNVKDQVEVGVANLDDLSTAQWVIVMSRTSFQVEPMAFVDIQMTVGLPKAWQVLSDNKVTVVNMVVSSGGAKEQGGSFTNSLPVFIRTVGFSVPGFDATFAILGAASAALIAGAAAGQRRRLIK
jgi:hypothetical protein